MATILNDVQYKGILHRIEQLITLVDDNTPEKDPNYIELDLLATLVEEYEKEHYPIQAPSLIEVLKLRLFELGLSQSALAHKLGMNQSKISEILSGKSEPTLAQAKRMVRDLDISPSVILA